MDTTRSWPIIAVFGSSSEDHVDVLELADRMGQTISEHEAMILTGGTGPADKPVKNRAIQGAMRRHSAYWIGVDRKLAGPGEGFVQDRGYLIESSLNHQRNYLEACMCDAAICLYGGDGTTSELASCLCLRRPVALVGSEWKKKCDLDDDRSVALQNLIEASNRTFRRTGEYVLGPHLIGETAITEGLHNMGLYRYFDSNASEQSILDWLLSVLPPYSELPGYFPDIDGHEIVAREYAAWLGSKAASPS